MSEASYSKTRIEENKERQAELRRLQRERDKDRSFGNDYKNPCKNERQMSNECNEMKRFDPNLDCSDYYENYKTCKLFWNAVQQYRCMYQKKRRHDYPKDEEYEKWKKKLPEWLETKNLTPPDDL